MGIEDDKFDRDFHDYPEIDFGQMMENINKAKNDPNFKKQELAKYGIEVLEDKGKEEFSGNEKEYRKFSIGKDLSFWFLLASNLIAIFLINERHVGVGEVMIIFWIQSVVIGIVNFVRIVMLKSFYAEKIIINGKIPVPTLGVKTFIAILFVGYYFFLHLAFLAYILGTSFDKIKAIGWSSILSTTLVFLLNHTFSFAYNYKEEVNGKNILSVVFGPLVRVFPMQIMIIIGSMLIYSGLPLVAMNFFLFLKMSLDLFAHVIKHKNSRKWTVLNVAATQSQ